MANPTITLEAAFGSNPFVLTPTWTDITSDLRGFTIRRGSGSGARDTVQAGTITLQLNNGDADYSPWNVTYDMKPMTRIRLKANHNAVDYWLFTGFLESVKADWVGGDYGVVTLKATDGFKALSYHETAVSQVEELTGTRIGNYLDEASWPATWRNLDTGDFSAAAHDPTCEAVLGLIQDTVKLEAPTGTFYIAGDGDATFHDSTHVYPALVTYGDAGGSELPYQSLDVDWDDSQIWNEVTAVATDGSSLSDDDATSIGKYFKRTLKWFDAHAKDATDLATIAAAVLAEYKDPSIRISRIRITPHEDSTTAAWAAVLGDDLGQPIRVIRRPTTGPNLSEDVTLTGLTLNVNRNQWRVTYDLG